MLKITFTMDTDNDAFEGDASIEAARLLTQAAKRIASEWDGGNLNFALMDVNGNRVGRATVEEA